MTDPPQKRLRTWAAGAEAEILRSLCQQSFWFFFQWGFGARANPKGVKWIDESVHKPIADWFQKHVEEWIAWRAAGEVKQKHLAIVVHREVGKTTLITQAGQCWLHLRDPEISTYTASEKLELAEKILGPIKAVFDGTDRYALWTQLFGNWATNSRTWKAGEIVHAARRNTARKDPSLGTCGVETSIVGAHPDAIFRDDPISYERIKTDSDWFGSVRDQTTSLIPVLQGDGLFVDIGTRYGAQDHFGTSFETPEEGGAGVASLTGTPTDAIRVHPEGLWHVYFMAGRDENDKPTTPRIWPETRLKYYKRDEPIRFAAQIMNDPAQSDTNPIIRSELMQCLVSAKDVPWNAMVFAIICDLALWDGAKRINKDETVYQVWGYPRNGSGDVYFIEGDGSMYWRDEEYAKILVSLIQRYRRQGRRFIGMACERAMAGLKGVWATSLRNRLNEVNESMPTMHELNRGGTKKIQRISSVMDFWKDGHVRVVKDAPVPEGKLPAYERLFAQMERIGEMQLTAESGKRSKRKDDWVDAMADAFLPIFYQPMRRPLTRSPWEKDAQAISTPGLNTSRWGALDESGRWRDDNPRPPIR